MTRRTVNFRLPLAILFLAFAVVHVNGAAVYLESPTPRQLPGGRCYLDDDCPIVHFCYIVENRLPGECRLTWWIVLITVVIGTISLPFFIVALSFVMLVVCFALIFFIKTLFALFKCIFIGLYQMFEEFCRSCGHDCQCNLIPLLSFFRRAKAEPETLSSASRSTSSWPSIA
jgi:hypothetical protein